MVEALVLEEVFFGGEMDLGSMADFRKEFFIISSFFWSSFSLIKCFTLFSYSSSLIIPRSLASMVVLLICFLRPGGSIACLSSIGKSIGINWLLLPG
jgi:hypothetical protein